MTQDLIRYDLLVQDALKGVVRKVLGDATRDGLPGDHHFYISFRTDFPGVRLSTRMREKYPQDMTIVLQHQFWDLAVTEHALEVGLSFSGVPERLLIPFDAMTGFFDPSVQFGLKFEIQEPPQVASPAPAPAPAPVAALHRPETPETGAKPALPRGAASEPDVAEPASAARPSGKMKAGETAKAELAAKAENATEKVKSGKGPATKAAREKTSGDATAPGGADAASAQVVSLDAFRKK